MIVIEVYNAHCKVFTTERVVHAYLDTCFSASVDGAFFTTMFQKKLWDGKYHAYNRMNGTFKRGLLNQVVKKMEEAGYEFIVKDLRVIPGRHQPVVDSLMFDEAEYFRTLRNYQIQGVDLMIEHSIGIIKAATNAGKTEMFCELIRRLNLSAVVLCMHKELFHQTADRLRIRLGIPVGQVGDGLFDIQRVTVVMPGSAVKLVPVSGRKTKVPALVDGADRLVKTDIFIFDECHNFGDSRVEYLIEKTSAFYRFALSGTPLMKDRANNLKLQGFFGEVIFEISNQKLIAEGISSVPSCFFIPEEGRDIVYLPYDAAYQLGIVGNLIRNQKAAALANMLVEKFNKTVLIICAQVEHCVLMQAELPDASVSHGGCTSAHRTRILSRFKAGDIKQLIVTTIYDEGIDTDKIDCIIMLAGMMTPERILQRVGRGLRKRESGVFWYFDFLDTGNEYLLDHSVKRIEYLKAEGFSVKLMKNPDI